MRGDRDEVEGVPPLERALTVVLVAASLGVLGLVHRSVIALSEVARGDVERATRDVRDGGSITIAAAETQRCKE